MKHDWKNIERNNNPNITIEATNTCCALKKKKKGNRQRETISRGENREKEKEGGGKKRILNLHRVVTTSKRPPNVESHPPLRSIEIEAARLSSTKAARVENWSSVRGRGSEGDVAKT